MLPSVCGRRIDCRRHLYPALDGHASRGPTPIGGAASWSCNPPPGGRHPVTSGRIGSRWAAAVSPLWKWALWRRRPSKWCRMLSLLYSGDDAPAMRGGIRSHQAAMPEYVALPLFIGTGCASPMDSPAAQRRHVGMFGVVPSPGLARAISPSNLSTNLCREGGEFLQFPEPDPVRRLGPAGSGHSCSAGRGRCCHLAAWQYCR